MLLYLPRSNVHDLSILFEKKMRLSNRKQRTFETFVTGDERKKHFSSLMRRIHSEWLVTVRRKRHFKSLSNSCLHTGTDLLGETCLFDWARNSNPRLQILNTLHKSETSERRERNEQSISRSRPKELNCAGRETWPARRSLQERRTTGVTTLAPTQSASAARPLVRSQPLLAYGCALSLPLSSCFLTFILKNSVRFVNSWTLKV